MQGLEEQFGTFLHSLEEKKIVEWFDLVLWFTKRYASAYELEGTIYLVLDNSLIQDFKHREKDAKRALRATSYLAFCRFVRDWSDRPSHLAISPGNL
ncbi:hypothetical protein [Paraburkholderia sp. EG304]|uniref:hypothetical protein n=1 Tax=Paraburkholderia sp. EG304 TaxID=3237015 RepID=UPI00397BDB88